MEVSKFGLAIEMNGYSGEETVQTVAEIAPWLQAAIAHFFPNFLCCRINPESGNALRAYYSGLLGNPDQASWKLHLNRPRRRRSSRPDNIS